LAGSPPDTWAWKRAVARQGDTVAAPHRKTAAHAK
jgi:hypothetical protein